MNHISLDIETYSSVDLNKSSVYRYSEAPDFEILLLGYSVDDGPVQVVDLASGERIPAEILAALTDEHITKWAFNANFERVCLSRYLGLPNDESELIRQVVSQNASAALDQEEYARKYDSLTERFHKAADRVKEIDAECARRKGQRREIETFRDTVLANDQPVTVFSTELWNATIDRMTVNLDGSVKVAFRNGIEITV